MSFWDSSALVPLLLAETRSREMRAHYDTERRVTVWWGTRVECLAAAAQRRREGKITAEAEGVARRELEALARVWTEMTPSLGVRQGAERAVVVHDLGAADALQLAAALVWAEGAASGRALVTLDRRLRGAALREGFQVLPEELPEK